MKTKELNAKVFPYIINAIDASGYDQEPQTDKEKLDFVNKCFESEYCYPYNIQRYGSYQNCFAQWLMGLPSCINIDYEYYHILRIAKLWKSIPEDATKRQEQKILDNWFNFIAAKFFQLCKRHKVETVYTKKEKA